MLVSNPGRLQYEIRQALLGNNFSFLPRDAVGKLAAIVYDIVVDILGKEVARKRSKYTAHARPPVHALIVVGMLYTRRHEYITNMC